MRLRYIVPVLALSLATGALALQPEGGEPRPGEPPAGPREGGPREAGRRGGAPSVEGGMKAMGRAAEELAKTIASAEKRDENLKWVFEMQRGCAASKASPLPGKVTRDLPADADKAKAAESMRVHLTALMRTLLDLEDAIAAGKTEEAQAIFKKVSDLAEKGHTEFKVGND